ncbi:MAG: hypothetical protein M3430_21895 [Acidobacteriota bacterium]|nr:hypothetical protein [Acidobacteriota bacterium]
MYEDFEAIRRELTERQIKLLGSHVRTTLYVRPGDANSHDDVVLVRHELIEPAGGALHRESLIDNRAAEQPSEPYHPTEKGRAWFEWYDEQSKGRS